MKINKSTVQFNTYFGSYNHSINEVEKWQLYGSKFDKISPNKKAINCTLSYDEVIEYVSTQNNRSFIAYARKY